MVRAAISRFSQQIDCCLDVEFNVPEHVEKPDAPIAGSPAGHGFTVGRCHSALALALHLSAVLDLDGHRECLTRRADAHA